MPMPFISPPLDATAIFAFAYDVAQLPLLPLFRLMRYADTPALSFSLSPDISDAPRHCHAIACRLF